jgi:hypothetical protein
MTFPADRVPRSTAAFLKVIDYTVRSGSRTTNIFLFNGETNRVQAFAKPGVLSAVRQVN